MSYEAMLRQQYREARTRMYGETPTAPKAPTWKGIADEVARKHGLELRDILSHARSPALSSARWEAWATVQATLENRPTMGQLSRWFNRDHSTIHHGLKRYAATKA